MRTLRWTLGLTLLALQLVAMVQARFVPTRYFCWAPFDMRSDYRIEAVVEGRSLSDDEIRQRYQLRAEGRDMRSWSHVMRVIELAEQHLHPDERSQVTVHYSVNGRPEQLWEYRQP